VIDFNPLPKRRDSLINETGHPKKSCLPECINVDGKYINTMYRPSEITSDWVAYRHYLAKEQPDFSPKITFVGHDESEIENITLMSLGGVVLHMNGAPNYALLGSNNINLLENIIAGNGSEWVGFNIYTGFEEYVFDWIRQYKIDAAQKISRTEIKDFKEADIFLKKLVSENNGPIFDKGKLMYAPVIIGGHYNNYSYTDSFNNGADYVVRGKGINLLRDILLGLFRPGIYHDPMPYANIPMMDREGFYRDTYNFSDHTKKYAQSKIKSVLTALGCSYSCTYCYIGSLIDNLNSAYKDTGLRPPSIIQDRDLDTVIEEGKEIRRLDSIYGVSTTAVFDQADISLNNISWWKQLSSEWMQSVKIPFYIQARPAMLAGKAGISRIEVISKHNLVSGISMAIESGDEEIRKLLLDRHENNSTIISAIENVKSFNIPLRTQAIVGLPVVKPSISVDNSLTTLSLTNDNGSYYYKDPFKESIKCLALVCSSKTNLRDYYWNAIYSPFPGTPLGDYTIAAGFSTRDTIKDSYLFGSKSKLTCFDRQTSKRQIGFAYTSNFFSHLSDGAEKMLKFLYENTNYDLACFTNFVKHEINYKIDPNNPPSDEEIDSLTSFIEYAYPDNIDHIFKEINLDLTHYYINSYDGIVLAAKVASAYFKKETGHRHEFSLSDLYRIERNHYYDDCYLMNHIPSEFSDFFNKTFNNESSWKT